ncbi:MAG TPA: hypothetical protein DC057_03420 [Spirochaetia bacterium]|nr:hypothetical protein [Spirochaetia bacterium]
MLKSGKYRGEKVLYPDGIGCCIWLPLDEYEDTGLAFDFSYDDIDDIINMLQLIRGVEPEIYKEDESEIL